MLWGVRPRDGIVTFWDGALAHANKAGYESVRVLTVEWAIAAPNGESLDSGACLGIAKNMHPTPWTVYSLLKDETQVFFRTSDQPEVLGEHWNFTFPSSRSTGKGVRRRAFTIDLDKGKVMAWADGVQVKCSSVRSRSTHNAKTSPATFKPGLKFVQNELLPFSLGGASSDAHSRGDMTPSESDWIFHGVRVSAGAIYANDGPGTPQRRLAGGQIHDGNASFGSEPSTIGFLKQNVDPLDSRGGMLVQFQDGPASESPGGNHGVLIASETQGGGTSNLASPVIKNLSLESRSSLGTPRVLGPKFDLKIEHVDVEYGRHGIGNYAMGNSWTTRLDAVQCEFAEDAGLCLLGHILYARNLEISYPGTTAIRLSSIHAQLENIFLGPAPPRSESLIRIHEGKDGNLASFRNIIFDGEGAPNPSVAGFLIDNNLVRGPFQIHIEKFAWGVMGPKAVMVKLMPAVSENFVLPANCSVRDGVFQDPKIRAVFDVRSNCWHYDTDNLLFKGDPPPLATSNSSPSRKASSPSEDSAQAKGIEKPQNR
ncbi:MAG: hypothetical protein NVSMB14_06450 [Isosphaeraceae bacterium]